MIEVDGSFGEGGGQILRTAVAMSAIKGEPVRISKIRSGRENPGLRPQHLKAVEAVGLLCDAKVTGLEVGSSEVSFFPGRIRPGPVEADIGTAGSITLLLQAMLPVALKAQDDVVIDAVGGTDVSHSPTIDYFEHAFFPVIRSLGCDAKLEVLMRGFYPKGGGRIRLRTKPWVRQKRVEFLERGPFESVEAYSTATEHLRGQEVAERQVKGFLNQVSPICEVRHIREQYVKSLSIGTSFTAVAKYGDARIGACTLGERGIKAEEVGRSAAEILLGERTSNAPLDQHMSDQIIPYLALAGGIIRPSRITPHTKTNIDVARLFGFGLEISGDTIVSPKG